ncbi:MAG: hypothetical protein ACI4WH_05125 [Oscillospiraceae bacterium]
MDKESVKKIIHDWIDHNDLTYDEFDNGLVIDNGYIKLMFYIMDNSLMMGISSDTIPLEKDYILQIIKGNLNLKLVQKDSVSSKVLLNNRCKYLLKASNTCQLSKFGLIPIEENGIPCRMASKVQIMWDIIPIDEPLIDYYANILLEEAMRICLGFTILDNINKDLNLTEIETLLNISHQDYENFEDASISDDDDYSEFINDNDDDDNYDDLDLFKSIFDEDEFDI